MSVYDQEQKRMDERPSGGGGGGDYDWLEISKPARKGDKTQKRVRVIQRLPWIDGPSGKVPDPTNPASEFWMRTDVHRTMVEGKFGMLVCPENHDVEGWRERATCPLCVLQRELWATKNPDWDQIAKDMGTRTRCYANVIDMEDQGSHWKEDGNGGWKVRPKIYGYGYGIHKEFMSICVNLGPIEDWQTGRDLIIECERTGPKKMNVKFRIMNCDREAVPNELLPVVQGAFDLEGLAKAASMEDLRKAAAAMDPRPAGSSSRSPAPVSGGGHNPPPSGGSTSSPPPGHNPPPSGGPPPPAPAPARAAPLPPPRTQSDSGIRYHVSTDTGTQEGWSAEQVAIYAMDHGNTAVWTEGMGDWAEAATIPEIAAAVEALTPPPAAPDQPKGGYDVTPGPPPSAGGPPPPPTKAAGPPPPPGGQGGPPGGPPGGPAF